MSAYPLEIYRNIFGQWRWRIKANNGRKIAASTEGYHNRTDCVNNARSVANCLRVHFGCNNIDCSFEEVKP